MFAFYWIAAGIVILSMLYLTFALTVPEWLTALRKGQAVHLLPERKDGDWPIWIQVATLLLGLILCAPLFYYGWVPVISLPAPTTLIPAIVRHPMYFGAWVFMPGLLLLYPMWVMLIFMVSMLASLSMRARREEIALSDRFGDQWVDYRNRTKFIIPFI